jgi:hypothetical protein
MCPHWSSEDSLAHSPQFGRVSSYINFCLSHMGNLYIQASSDKYSCQQCWHVASLWQALTNKEVSNSYKVSLRIRSQCSHSRRCFLLPLTDQDVAIPDWDVYQGWVSTFSAAPKMFLVSHVCHSFSEELSTLIYTSILAFQVFISILFPTSGLYSYHLLFSQFHHCLLDAIAQHCTNCMRT